MHNAYTERPLIRKPDLSVAKIVTVLSIIMSIFTSTPAMSFIYSSLGTNIGIGFSLCSIFLFVGVLFLLGIYAENFKVNNIKYLAILVLIFNIAGIGINFILGKLDCPFLIISLSQIAFNSVLTAFIYCYIGIKLIGVKNDYIGGLQSIGYVLIGAAAMQICSSLVSGVLTYLALSDFYSTMSISSLNSVSLPLHMVTSLIFIALQIVILIALFNADNYNESVRRGN